jgi:hypothetical protein
MTNSLVYWVHLKVAKEMKCCKNVCRIPKFTKFGYKKTKMPKKLYQVPGSNPNFLDSILKSANT